MRKKERKKRGKKKSAPPLKIFGFATDTTRLAVYIFAISLLACQYKVTRGNFFYLVSRCAHTRMHTLHILTSFGFNRGQITQNPKSEPEKLELVLEKSELE